MSVERERERERGDRQWCCSCFHYFLCTTLSYGYRLLALQGHAFSTTMGSVFRSIYFIAVKNAAVTNVSIVKQVIYCTVFDCRKSWTTLPWWKSFWEQTILNAGFAVLRNLTSFASFITRYTVPLCSLTAVNKKPSYYKQIALPLAKPISDDNFCCSYGNKSLYLRSIYVLYDFIDPFKIHTEVAQISKRSRYLDNAPFMSNLYGVACEANMNNAMLLSTFCLFVCLS